MAWNGFSEKGQGSEERGPGTFTFAPPATPQAQGVGAVTAKMGYQTVQSVGGLTQYNEQGDKTAAAIFGFAETMLKPVVAEIAGQKFLEGAQRAATGEALTEIVNEQPWYSKIFGTSSAVEGARQYSLDAQAAKFDAAVQQAMPTLRGTSPDELPGIIQKMSKEFETGDTATDTQLGLRVLKTLPNLIQAHTREFYKAQQEHAVVQRFSAAQEAATSLQIAAQNPMSTEDDVQLRQAGFLQMFVLPNGVDPEGHKQFVSSALQHLADSGQFHAVNVAMQGGATQALPLDKRAQLERYVGQAKRQHAIEAREGYVKDMVRIYDNAKNGQYGAEQVIKEYEAINEDYTNLSGNDESMVPAATQASTASTALGAYWSRIKQAEQLQLKAAEELTKQGKLAEAAEQLDAAVVTTFKNNGYAGAKAFGYKTADVDRLFMKEWDAKGWPERTEMLRHHGAFKGEGVTDVVPQMVQVELSRLINSTGNRVNNTFLQAADMYQNLTKDPRDKAGQAAANAVFGTSEAAGMRKFLQEIDGIDVRDRANASILERAVAMIRDPLFSPTAKFTDKEEPLVDEYLVRKLQGRTGEQGASISGNANDVWWKLGSAPDPITPDALRLFKSTMAGHYRTLRDSGMPVEEAMDSAAQRASRQVDMVGSYGWSLGGSKTNLLQSINTFDKSGNAITKTQLAQGFNALIAETYEKQAGLKTMKSASIWPTMDADDGQQQFSVTFTNDDGTRLMPVYIKTSDVHAAVIRKEVDRVAKPTGFGPALTLKPDRRAPSPYAGPAEWAKYRELQKSTR